jgi:hypothetical protein
MSLSVVSICNRALDLLGADPIASLADDSKAARLCQRNYDGVRDSVLRAYPWNSAMFRATLPTMLASPAFGYRFQYQLPTGPEPAMCLRVYQVIGSDDYRIEGRRLLSNDPPPLSILYIGQVIDPNQFDPLLAETIAARLAVYLAANLTESSSRIDTMRQHYREVLLEARAMDAQEGRAGQIEAADWLNSRL